MPITFFNVKTGEKRTVDTEPLIAAFFNSSDQHVNVQQGQDFGWRIAPETVKRIREIKANDTLMAKIAQTFQLVPDAISDTDVLRWISVEDAQAKSAQGQEQESDYTQEYEDQIRALDKGDRVRKDPNPSQPAGVEKSVPRQEEHPIPENTTPSGEETSSTSEADDAKIEESTDNKET